MKNKKGHLNFDCKLDSGDWGMKWIETSENDAPFFQWDQMIIGDNSDCVVGPRGKGAAWCKKHSNGLSLREWQCRIFDEYISEYGASEGVYKFQMNYRLLHMLDTDEDFIREVGYLPKLPEFQKVNKEYQEPVKIEF